MRRCPICDGEKIVSLRGFGGYFYCDSCKTAWKKSFVRPDYERGYYSGSSPFATRFFSPVAAILYKLRTLYVGGDKLDLWIDVGAGEGGFLKAVNAKRKIGVEISNAGREMMTKSGLVAMTDREFLRARSKKADVISFWHVLEHVERPWEYLAAARRNLKKGGRIVIGVPNIDSLDFKIFGKFWFHLAPDYHFWHFSPKSIDILLRKSGFRPVTWDFWSVEHHLAGVLQSLINITGRRKNVLHKIVKRGRKSQKIDSIDYFWILFWLTLGLPLVIFLWVVSAMLKKSGTFVVVSRVYQSRK